MLAGPGEAEELQSYFGSHNLRMQWVLPLDLSSLDYQRVPPLSAALNKISTQVPALSGRFEPAASALTISTASWRTARAPTPA